MRARSWALSIVTNAPRSKASLRRRSTRTTSAPAVVGIGPFLTSVSGGETAIIDGYQGSVILHPDEETLARYRHEVVQYRSHAAKLEKLKDLPAETADGARIHHGRAGASGVALAAGGLPLLLMIFVRSKMPESRLWLEYRRRLRAGELPPEKLLESSPLLEIWKGASRRYFLTGTIIAGGYIIAYQSITIFMPTLMVRDLDASLAARIKDL